MKTKGIQEENQKKRQSNGFEFADYNE